MGNDLQELATLFAERTHERKRIEAELASVKKQLEELKEPILTKMQEGVSSIKVSGEHAMTVYLHRQVWATCKDKEVGCVALKAAGLDGFVKEGFNTQTLSKYFRDDLPKGDDGMPVMPEELAGKFEAVEVFDVRARKA